MSAEITKDNINDILKDLGKEYRKRAGKQMPAEIVMTGGAAIIAKYGFRTTSYDIDAIIKAASSLKDAALIIRDKYDLQQGWLNSDFKNTTSYSNKLYEHSHHYRTFANVLNIRIVDAEYLLATKLKAARPYKHDLSDIAGIIIEEKAHNPDFTKERVMNAYYDMYGKTTNPSKEAIVCMNDAFSTEHPKELIEKLNKKERNANKLLVDFQTEYPNVLNDDNMSDILNNLKTKHEKRKQQAEDKFGHIQANHPNPELGLGE